MEVFAVSEEKTNGMRLARLLVDGGTHVLRKVLHSIHPSATLQHELTNNFGILQKSKREISLKQWKMLFPDSGDPPPDSKTFDITLLHFLLRNICRLTAPPNGWHELPTDSDNSPEANIVRIKYFRNKLCHRVSTDIAKDEFEDQWNIVSSALVALGLDQTEVDRLKTEPIEHDTKSRIEEEVNKWKLEMEPRLESLEKDVQKIKGEMSFSDQNTAQLEDYLPDEVVNFFGRSQEIEQVIQHIVTREVGIVVITGGPGFGKTTVANKVGYKLRDLKNVVLFCSLRLKETVNDVANSMILTCSKNHFQPPENPQHWLRNWSKQQQQRIAFILDNADDVLESGDPTEFARLLTEMKMFSKGSVTFVVTSRKLLKDPSVKEVRLTPLSHDEAKKLIESKVDESVQVKLSQTEKLVELCGCAPLALCIVGSLLSDYTEDKLIRSLKEKPMDVLKEDLSDDNSIEKAIKTSFDYLRNSERQALLLLSAFPGSFDSTAATALITSSCPEQPELILRSLKNRSLVEMTAPQRYHIHQLIQAYANKIGQTKYSEGEKEAFAHFVSRLVDNANMYWSKDKCKESIEVFNEDRHNFEYFLQFYLQGLNCQYPSHLMANLTTLVEEFPQKCLYLEMCLLPSVYVKLLETWLDLLMSDDHPQQHTSKIVELLCLLAHEKRKIGNYDQYKQFLESAIKLHSENPNEFNQAKVSEAFFRTQYARFLSHEGNFDKAKEQFDIGLKVCEEYLTSKDYLQKSVTLLYSGREGNRHNERDKAKEKFNDALNLVQEGLGTHVMTALFLRHFADFHLFHGEKKLGSLEDRQNATKLYGQALQMMENLGIKDRKECILLFTNLGLCYQLKGELEEAMRLYQASRSIAERELAENHRWKIYVIVQMAYSYKQKGNMVEAKAWKEKALQMSDALGLSDNEPPNKFILKEI